MKIVNLLMLVVYCVVATGCATVIHGRKQEIAVATNPPDATISDGKTTVQSPGKLILDRNKDHMITITKPGFYPETVRVSHVISGAVFGNIAFWTFGLIGWGVDAISGAQWRLEPETVNVTLHPETK